MSEKLKMHTTDITGGNVEQLGKLFPNCLTEVTDSDGVVQQVIDFDLLRQELSGELVEGPRERYQLDWPGKREALLAANSPIAKTLRPCREESLDFDTTENLFIEGDNLEALKLLQETYLNKVKMIYIDPPYNTGKDFIYSDNFAESADEYLLESGQVDEEGNRLVANSESNGRFHSDWLSMMYSRLKLARNLLSEDGVIFISIDDNEMANVRRLCDSVFGEGNLIGTIVWRRSISANDSRTLFSNDHEYILVFRKTTSGLLRGLPKESTEYKNLDDDPRGPWKKSVLVCSKTKDERPNLFYPITDPSTGKVYACNPKLVWMYNRETMRQKIEDGLIIFPDDVNKRPMLKLFWSDLKSHNKPLSSMVNFQKGSEFELTAMGSKDLSALFDMCPLDYPKPVTNLKTILSSQLFPDNNEIVLDFFAGSSTTAHAVMELNAEDGGNRRFIMVQLPEECGEKSEAYKAGYSTIAEISKERIRRAGKKIKEENPLTTQELDTGFRVLKIDSSNMKDVYYAPDGVKQGDLLDQIENVKEDRTSEDLLFQVLLDWGVDLSLRITQETLADKKVFFVDEDSLAACFETEITEELVKLIAERKPLRVVFRDAGFNDDSVKINVEQIFKQYSPNTDVKAI